MKKVFLIAVAIIAAIFIAAAFMPKDFKISQEINVNRKVPEVYQYLRFLKNGKEWSPWENLDKNITKEFKGTDGEVGATFSWAGDSSVGVGSEEIIALEENKKISFELRFEKPMKVTNQAHFLLEKTGDNQTKITWEVSGRTPYPFNIICYFMHGEAAKDLAQGLENIKTNLEK